MPQDEWVNIDEWEDIPSTPQVQAPSSFGGRLGEFGSGMLDFAKTIGSFGNPISFALNYGSDPQGTLEKGRNLFEGMVVDPLKDVWGGLTSSDPTGLTRGLFSGGSKMLGLNPENIKQDYNEGNYGALAGDFTGPLAAAALTGGAMRYGKGMGTRIPLPEVLPPEMATGPIKRLIGKVERSDINIPREPLQLEAPPERLQLPAFGETSVTGDPRFIQGKMGMVDTSLEYPVDMVDPGKIANREMTYEIANDKYAPRLSTLLPEEMGELGSLNPIDVASGNFSRRIGMRDPAQLDPAFAALVPNRLSGMIDPNTSGANIPLGLRTPQVEAPTLANRIGGEVVEPPPTPPIGAPFSMNTLTPEESMGIRPKAPREQPNVYPPGARLEPTRTNFDADNIQYQLRDVGKDMNPAVKKAGASNVPELQAAAAQVRASRPNFIRNTYDYLGTSGWSILDNMGQGGMELSRFMRRTRAESKVAAGSVISKHREPIDKLSSKEFAAAVDVIESKGKASNPKVQKAVDSIKAMLEEAGVFAENSGMLMANPTGQLTKFQRMREGYFPHKWAPGTFDEGSLINQLIQKGMSPTQAKFVVEQGIKTGPRLISPQHMRSLDIPGYLKTKGALFEHVDDLMTRAVEAQKYGPSDLGNPNSPIMQAISKTEDPDRALNIARDQLGRIKRDPDLERVASGVNTFEATVKLPLFAISNINQSAAIGMRASTGNFVRGFIDTIKGIKSAEDTGALQTTAINILRETGQNVITRGASKLFGWAKSEEFLRSWAANAGKSQADALFKRVKSNPTDLTARAQLDDLLLEDVDKVTQQPTLTDQQRKVAGFRMAELTQGLVDPADLPPMWSGNPLLRIPLMFKRFAFQQNKILKDSILSAKTPQERILMGAKLLALYTVTGEVTKDIKTAIAGIAEGKDPLEDMSTRGGGVFGRIISNISNAYALGLAGEIIEQTASGSPGRVLSFLAGPAIADIVDVGTGAARSINQGDVAPIGRELMKLTPLGYATSRRVLPPNNVQYSIGETSGREISPDEAQKFSNKAFNIPTKSGVLPIPQTPYPYGNNPMIENEDVRKASSELFGLYPGMQEIASSISMLPNRDVFNKMHDSGISPYDYFATNLMGTQSDKTKKIYLNPRLEGMELKGVLAHELGHGRGYKEEDARIIGDAYQMFLNSLKRR